MNTAHARMAMILAIPIIALALLSARPEIDMGATSSIAASVAGEEGFRLFSGAADRSADACSLAAGDAPQGAPRPLRLASACLPDNPQLAGARWWLERADGTVALAAAAGRILAEFAAADGTAFESYYPRQPVMTLLADD